MEHMTVSYPMTLRLLSSQTGSRPLPAQFHYSARDPLAVTVVFDAQSESPVSWVFARDLLAEGLDGRAGIGDISLWPTEDEAGLPALQIRLSSPDGDAYILASASQVEEFLARTWRVVPPGAESALLGIDLALVSLLDGA
ncbi:SsgA family sporulation/cell division regulator [Phytoactinopolyspora alkaliphila]|uniref:SsgA family sporulation/cell division regulator n=1 Tax=Phytoactinopolyspora alkaliphila TaxID=1783498 RepID=A0A6N9YGX4_9ACTN|nr:SsgA family sporulation/cell division regulator [Phytoactinopolyspora alkaliphila]NED94175.1 SsgA family sporulation/cell division regulator [Phytoactinopolyspora alkaliphila]